METVLHLLKKPSKHFNKQQSLPGSLRHTGWAAGRWKLRMCKRSSLAPCCLMLCITVRGGVECEGQWSVKVSGVMKLKNKNKILLIIIIKNFEATNENNTHWPPETGQIDQLDHSSHCPSTSEPSCPSPRRLLRWLSVGCEWRRVVIWLLGLF